MEEALLKVFICSMTMTVPVGILLAASLFRSEKYSCRSIYIGWILIMLGFLIPVRPRFPGNIFSEIGMPYNLEGIRAEWTDAPAYSGGNIHVAGIAAAVWLIGASLCFAYFVYRQMQFNRRLKRWCAPDGDQSHWEAANQLRMRLQVKPFTLLVSQAVNSPMAGGILRPYIVLPQNMRFTESQLEMALEHELVHIVRRDPLVRLFTAAAVSLHWFNPLVWASAGFLNRYCEFSCDETVAKGKGFEEKFCYFQAVAETARSCNGMQGNALGLSNGSRDMKRRMDIIMENKKKKAAIGIVSCAVIAAAALGFLFFPVYAKEDVRYVDTNTLNLREGPGYDSKVINLLPKDCAVTVIGEEAGGWLKVSVDIGEEAGEWLKVSGDVGEEGQKAVGYIAEEYVRR